MVFSKVCLIFYKVRRMNDWSVDAAEYTFSSANNFVSYLLIVACLLEDMKYFISLVLGV
jgi:hypothetical protein